MTGSFDRESVMDPLAMWGILWCKISVRIQFMVFLQRNFLRSTWELELSILSLHRFTCSGSNPYSYLPLISLIYRFLINGLFEHVSKTRCYSLSSFFYVLWEFCSFPMILKNGEIMHYLVISWCVLFIIWIFLCAFISLSAEPGISHGSMICLKRALELQGYQG